MTPFRIPILRGRTWLLIRIAVYALAALMIYQARQSVDWRGLSYRSPTAGGADTLLSITGGDLAPDLAARLVAFYRRDNPRTGVEFRPGGTNRALEDLVNCRTDVAFLARRVCRSEQDLFVRDSGDSVLCFPVALGGLMLLAHPEAAAESLRVGELQRLLAEGKAAGFRRLYAPDPNQGQWDALMERLGRNADDGPAPGSVVFLEDDAAVLAAVRADPSGLGLASSLFYPGKLAPDSIRTLAVSGDSAGATAVLPTDDNVGSAAYPLYHYLYVACRAHGGPASARFVTHLTSSRGQRQVERSGFLPAHRFPREVILTTHPVGEKS